MQIETTKVRLHFWAAVGFLVLLVSGLFVWSLAVPLSGAIMATGKIEVATAKWRIEHDAGGRVQALHISEGENVSLGQLLVQLDASELEAQLAILNTNLRELRAQQALALAERDGDKTPLTKTVLESNNLLELFETRKRSFEQSISQLKEQQKQLNSERTGLDAQVVALIAQRQLIETELKVQLKLRDQALVNQSHIRDIEMQAIKIDGQLAALEADRSRNLGSFSELELQILALKTTREQEAIETLRSIEPMISELREKIELTETQIDSMLVRAPINGIVHDLRVLSIGEVVQPGSLLLQIVPLDSKRIIVAKLAPTEVDQVTLGQVSFLQGRSQFDHVKDGFTGSVSKISADVFTEQKTGREYFRVEIEIDDELQFQEALFPGVPIDVFLSVGTRTAFEYLVGPIAKYFDRAMREG